MGRWQIASFEESDLEAALNVWEKAFSDRVYDFRMDGRSFRKQVLSNSEYDPEGAFVARMGGETVGFALAAAPKDGTTGFLSVLMVNPACRRRGIGSALLGRAETFLADRGKEEARVTYKGNPISFAVGADVRTPAYYFLLNRGFRNVGPVSLLMQMDLDDFKWTEEVSGFVRDNEAHGIRLGLCRKDHREALCRFMEEVFPGGWDASVKRALQGDPPYPVIVATDGPQVVGFSGPVRVQVGGRGGFTGIGTRPEYRRRKIGTVLFHLLCREFKTRGATYSTLHTGFHNPAQEIYFGAGFKVRHLIDHGLMKRLA